MCHAGGVALRADGTVGASVRSTRNARLAWVRRVAVGAWAAFIIYRLLTTGIAFNRELLLLYICTGLAAASIGRRRVLYVLRDWLPFALVLVVYDLSRGAADLIGRPTMWHWQADGDRWMFSGVMPTVWLQEHLKQPHPPWWEVVISTTYMSFFILPYVIGGVLWLRNREEWKKFVQLFVVLSFTAGHLCGAARRAPLGGRQMHPGRRHHGSVGPAVHVPRGAGIARRRHPRPHECPPTGRPRLDRADIDARLGKAQPQHGPLTHR